MTDQTLPLAIPNSNSFHGEFQGNNNEDTLFDGFLHQSAKIRRLSVEQVQFLEKNFEVENKLEAERKIQVAKQLGIEPRQVAIWFQNRRARNKTKQVQKDFSSLETSYQNLKSNYDALFCENQKMKTELENLKQKLGVLEKGKKIVKQDEGSSKSSMADSSRRFEAEPCDEEENLTGKLESCYYDQALGFWPFPHNFKTI